MPDLDPELLRRHQLAVFRDRLVLHAQPPLTAERQRAVEERIGAAVPDGLLALWRIAFGGALDYDLAIRLDHGEQVTASFTELFYPGSDHYHDLFG